MDVNAITGSFYKVIFILFLLIDLSVLAERLLWQHEAEINAEPMVRHYKHHKNKQKHNEDITEVYGRLRTNLRHRSHHHQNYHHTKTTTTMSPPATTTTTQSPSTATSTSATTTTATSKSIARTPEEHRLRHSNKFYQAFNLNHDYNHEKSNVRRYINQSSYPLMSTTNNPWKNLVSSTTYNNKHHSKQPDTDAITFYNVSKLMQNRLFDRGDGGFYSTRPPKIRHPYDVLKVPLKERVRIKPVRKSFDHNDLRDDSRLTDDDTDEVINWSSKKRHLKSKSNTKGKKLQDDYYEDDYYEDEEDGDVQDKNLGHVSTLRVKSMHQRTGAIEKRTFVNHTECFCDNKANAKSSSSRPEPMRRATIISCTCTKAFEQVLEEDGTCRCDCSSSNYACDWKKKGREHFSMEDRKCILEGRCEFGRYDKRHGRCPRKEDKIATGFSYHS